MTKAEHQEQVDETVASAQRALTRASVLLVINLVWLIVAAITVNVFFVVLSSLVLALSSILHRVRTVDLRIARREFPVRQFNRSLQQLDWVMEISWLKAHWNMGSAKGLASDYVFPGPHPEHKAKLLVAGTREPVKHAAYCRCSYCGACRELGLNSSMYATHL